MSLSDAAAFASVVSSLAVLVSLVYLALQVRHAANSQRSETQGSATERRIAVLIAQAAPDASNTMNIGMGANPDITDAQITQFLNLSNLIIATAEDEFFQHRDGLLDARRYTLSQGLLRTGFHAPGFRAAWLMSRAVCHPDFAAYADGVMQETPVGTAEAYFGAFRALAAQQRAGLAA